LAAVAGSVDALVVGDGDVWAGIVAVRGLVVEDGVAEEPPGPLLHPTSASAASTTAPRRAPLTTAALSRPRQVAPRAICDTTAARAFPRSAHMGPDDRRVRLPGDTHGEFQRRHERVVRVDDRDQ